MASIIYYVYSSYKCVRVNKWLLRDYVEPGEFRRWVLWCCLIRVYSFIFASLP